MIYVEVDDIPTVLQQVTDLGGETVVSETEIPGGGTFAWLKDLDGNLIGLLKRSA